MPIHHTKLTMANPQPMGMLMPQIPTPLMTSQPMATVINPMRLKAIEKPTNQPREVGRVRTIALILRSEEHTSELQSQSNLVCRLLLEKKNKPVILVYNAAWLLKGIPII